MMAHTLKLKGEMAFPGLALPEAFESLDSHLESVVSLCQLKGSTEAQAVGVVSICQELLRLLKCAFIENGMLASRMEILTKYHTESIKKMEKKLVDMDTENKITRKHMKRLRKQLSAYQVMQKKKNGEWWDVKVRTSDYDSYVALSRAGGSPDLEFMLRMNQIMIDFVTDSEKTELQLPAMGMEERQEVSKLASIYKLRCRYGKSVQLAPSTLLKARQACIPAPGEVDNILNNFTKTQRKAVSEEVASEEGKPGSSQESSSDSKDERAKLSPVSLPSSMLTPLSALPSPTVDISTFKLFAQSPPGSGLATPTEGPVRFLKQRDSVEMSGSSSSQRKGSTSAQPENSGAANAGSSSGGGLRSDTLRSSRQEQKKVKDTSKDSNTPQPAPTHENQPPSTSSSSSSSSSTSSAVSATPKKLPPTSHTAHSSSPSVTSSVGVVVSPASTGGIRSLGGGISVQQQIRGLGGHSTVVASPLKSAHTLSTQQASSDSLRSLRKEKEKEEKEKEEAGKKRAKEKEEEDDSREEGGGSARTDSMGPPVKRLRVTRRSVAEEEMTRP